MSKKYMTMAVRPCTLASTLILETEGIVQSVV